MFFQKFCNCLSVFHMPRHKARQCAKEGGTACATLNAANEEAVWAFLRGETGFNGIHRAVETALDRATVKYRPSLADILEADRLARETARAVLSR